MAGDLTVGQLRVILEADSSKFAAAMKDATADSKKLADSLKKELEPSTRGVNAAFKDFLGVNTIKRAQEMAEAVKRLGGATRLTEADQRKLNSAVQDALTHYKAMGVEGPKNLVALEQATRQQVVALSNVEKVQQHLQTQSKAFVGNIKDIALGYVTGQAAISAFTTAGRFAVDFMKDSIGQAIEAEKVQRKLTQALQQQGTAAPDVLRLFDALGKKYQETTTFSSGLIAETQLLLTQVGGVLPREMDSALEATTNLASGLGIDLRSATMMVAKAFEDNFAALGKAGVQIDETRAKTEGMTYVLDQINARFGGQAQADLDTYAGKIKQLENNYSQLKEEIGKAVIETGVLDHAMMLARMHIALTSASVEGLFNWLSALGTAAKGGFSTTAIASAMAFIQGQAEDTGESIDELSKRIQGFGRGLDRFDAPGQSAAQTKYWETVRQAAQKANDEQQKAMDNLKSGMADLNERQRTHIAILLMAGKSESDIAKAYGYTAQQVKEVAANEKLLADVREEQVKNSDDLLKVMDKLDAAMDKNVQQGAFANAKRFADAWIEQRKRMAKENSAISKQIADNFIETSKIEQQAIMMSAERSMSRYDFERYKVQVWAEQQKDAFRGTEEQARRFYTAVDQLAAEMYMAVETSWGDAFSSIAHGFKELAQITDGELSDIAGGIGESISLVGLFNESFDKIGEGGTKNLIAGLGGVAGAIAQGIGLAVELGKAIHDAVTRSQSEKAAADIRRNFGLDVTEDSESAKKVEALVEQLGIDRNLAIDLLLPDIARGQIDTSNFDQFRDRAFELFDDIHLGGEVGEIALKSLDDMIGQLGEHVVEVGGLWDTEFVNMLRRAQAEGLELASVMELVKGQLDIASGGANKLAGGFASGLTANGPKDQAEFDRISRLTLATFNARVGSGETGAEAISALGPAIDALKQSVTDFGLAGNDAFNQLNRWRDLATANQPLLDQLAGLNEMMVALANVGALDAQTFADMQAQGLDTFKSLTAAGFSQTEALAQMKPMLETLVKLHRERGLVIDDETQALIDQATEQGILQGEQIDTNQVLMDGLGTIIELLGGELPEAWRQMAEDAKHAADDVEDAFNDIEIDIPVNYDFRDPEIPNVEFPDFPGAATGAFVPKRPGGTLVRVGEGQHDEWIIPAPDFAALMADWNAGPSIPSLSMAGSMASVDSTGASVSVPSTGVQAIYVDSRVLGEVAGQADRRASSRQGLGRA